MADQKQPAEDTKQGVSAGEDASVASPAEGRGEISEPKAPLESEGAVKGTEGAATPEESETKPEDERGKRPTRAERRIRQLLDKLKEARSAAESGMGAESMPQTDTVSDILGIEGQPPWATSGESPIQPGAEVSVEELNAELNRRAATMAELKARQAIQEYEARQRFTKAVEEFSGELEKLSREVPELNPDSDSYEPDLDKKFAELVVEVNSDERGQFLPKKRPAEIWEALKLAMEKARTEGQSESTAKMAESLANAAVSPTAGARERRDYELEAALREAQEKGTTEAWADYLKKRLFGRKK